MDTFGDSIPLDEDRQAELVEASLKERRERFEAEAEAYLRREENRLKEEAEAYLGFDRGDVEVGRGDD